MSSVVIFSAKFEGGKRLVAEWNKGAAYTLSTYQGDIREAIRPYTDRETAIAAAKRKVRTLIKGGAVEILEFPESFTGTVYEGETLTLEHDGFVITAKIWADDDTTPPWEREEGHGPVADWSSSAKAPGQLVLSDDNPSGLRGRTKRRFYDFQEACRIALRDGWDSKPYNTDGRETKRQQAAKAARADYERLRKWCSDQWQYVGVALQVSRADIDLTGDYAAALWGIESDCPEYLTQVANELIGEALDTARDKLQSICCKAA